MSRWAHRELMRACDTSLEPSSHKNDQVMGQNRLARALCFLQHEALLNGRFEVAYVVSVTCFRALRARGAREAGFYFMVQFLLSRRFQRGIARPHKPTHIQTPPDGQTDTLTIFI